MNSNKIMVILLFLFLLLLVKNTNAKEWRNIVPLKSSRADVERLLGQPTKAGRYEFEKERAYIHYIERICDNDRNCLCLVPKDTVTSIYVELEYYQKFSELKVNKSKFERTVDSKFPYKVTFANYKEGIIYSVDEEDDDLIAIEYLPTEQACQEIIEQANKKRKKCTCNWILKPLETTKDEVEKLLNMTVEDNHVQTYKLKDGNLSVVYSLGLCTEEYKNHWNVPEWTVTQYTFYPTVKFNVKRLKLDPKKYRKTKDAHIKIVSYYVNDEEGIVYELQWNLVHSVTYSPPAKMDYL